jgi:hypothetical protein
LENVNFKIKNAKWPAVGRDEVFLRTLQFAIYNLNFAMRV